ncbi:hypothetical protein ILUMI_27153, partial [Ignelater luminosus]
LVAKLKYYTRIRKQIKKTKWKNRFTSTSPLSKMKQTCLLLCVIILLVGVPESFQECQLQSIGGVASYLCASIQELEAEENRGLFDVVIHKHKTPPSVNRKPNVKIVLIEDGKDAISADTFKLLKDVQKLFLRSNAQITLPASLLSSLPIQELDLRNNVVFDIENGAFTNLEGLKKLYIVDNKLSEVKYGVFNNLPIDTLGLSNNRLSFIERDAFINMTRLRRLDLDGNRLTEFEPEILMNNPHKLEVLHLQNNLFTEIDRNTVKGLNNLKVLNFKNNKISQISSYTFDQLLNLEELILSHNFLLELKPESFPKNGLPKLRKLHINNNRLSYLTTTVLRRLDNLRFIRITGNPWQCPCLDAILGWLSDRAVQQKCDRDYYDGTRPICVVDAAHPNTCDYSNNQVYHQKYTEINNKSPPSPPCEL